MQLPSNTTQILANEAANYKFTKTIYGCNLNSNTILTQASFNELIDTDTNTCVPCNGSVSILIDSVLQPQYLWSNSNTTNKNEMLCPGVYYVTVTNSTCSKVITTSILQGINLDANYSTSPPSAAGCDGNFSSIIYGGTPPYNKSFIPIATDSTLCVNTTYNFLVEDSKGCIVTKTNAYYYHSDNDTLWPGDADKNGYVDNYDLMSIVMHNYENGIARNTLTIQWQPIFPTINWMGTLQINNVDRKHSDCNGNGLIDTIDADAIILNYGITGKNSYAKPFDPAGPELKFISAKTNYAAGEMVEIIVVAGTSQKPIYKQKFLGVQVELPLQVIEPGTISATDIYNQSFPLWDDYKFAQSDGAIQCDFAHAVFNNFNLFNWHGEVFRISFQVANNLQSVQSHQVEIKNYRLIDMTDASIIMNYQPLTLAFNPVSIADQMHDNGISIFPNPANGELNIYANKQMIRYVELTDAAGRAIVQLATMENQIKLNISDVSNGLYQCKIILNNDQEIKSKVNIMH
ncbi:MAG: T9SS type A sorting domain-containing protein [Bacteroidetes bacterium]|nr:T9SS type A sorting domain-containing protein [Bacteroidota bacterium]